MPDRVHAAVHAVEAAAAKPVLHGGRRQVHADQLPVSDDAVLSARERGDRPVTWYTLRAHIAHFRRHVGHEAKVAGRCARVGARPCR